MAKSTKICSRCNEEKHVDDFPKQKRRNKNGTLSKDGPFSCSGDEWFYVKDYHGTMQDVYVGLVHACRHLGIETKGVVILGAGSDNPRMKVIK